MNSIPQFLIAAPTSGGGKTTISRGLMALLKKKGLKVKPFKCGPDYIDTKYHGTVCESSSINLDTFMASKEHVRELYARHSADADVCIVEGMMGLFDGYDRDRGSSAEIAKLLDLPVVLVVDAKSTAYSLAASLSGFIHFRPEIQIAGVIFNRVGSPGHYEMLQEVCAELNVTCLGYLVKDDRLRTESRYLGLNFSGLEGDNIDCLVTLLEESVDLDLLLKKVTCPLPEVKQEAPLKTGKLHITVARSEDSFSFIYQEHLDILHRMGTVSFFNPEHNRPISQKTDLLYLPGGYPEIHSDRLAKAFHAKESIRNYIEAGGKVLAECGGMIYLSYAIAYDAWIYQRDDRGFDKMVGIFPFYVSDKGEDRKLSLGYRRFEYNGQQLRGHEFHYTQFGKEGKAFGEDIENYYLPSSVAQVYTAKGTPVNTPVFRYKNVIASYAHLYWGETDIMRLFDE